MTDEERDAIAMLEPLIEHVRELEHEPGCPQDDTCECPERARLWTAADYAILCARHLPRLKADEERRAAVRARLAVLDAELPSITCCVECAKYARGYADGVADALSALSGSPERRRSTEPAGSEL